MNGMTYNGYTARIDFDADDRIFVGHILGINDIVGFHADTVVDLEAAFRDAVDGYVDACAKTGKPPERPYSGRVMFRVRPEVHARAALKAKIEGKSLNQWAAEALERAAG